MPKPLQTMPDVYAALGGISGVAAAAHARYRTAHGWKARGRFPSHTYILLNDEISRRGYVASPHLWGMIEPTPAPAPTAAEVAP